MPWTDLALLQQLFDRIPDAVFFVKDTSGRYTAASRTLLERCGIPHREKVLGRTAADLFRGPLGASFHAQDLAVLRSGRALTDRLELHLYPDGREGWCLTSKYPIPGPGGKPSGLVGLSRDLGRPDRRHPEYRHLARAVETVQTRYADRLSLAALAQDASLSMDRFERMVREVFGVTPRQLLARTRVDAATRLLATSGATVADVAQACGYADHSAFSRQFRALTGLTPREFRARRAAPDGRPRPHRS